MVFFRRKCCTCPIFFSSHQHDVYEEFCQDVLLLLAAVLVHQGGGDLALELTTKVVSWSIQLGTRTGSNKVMIKTGHKKYLIQEKQLTNNGQEGPTFLLQKQQWLSRILRSLDSIKKTLCPRDFFLHSCRILIKPCRNK